MVLSRMNFQSEDETLVVDITKNDEYDPLGGWDVEVHQFPMGNLSSPKYPSVSIIITSGFILFSER